MAQTTPLLNKGPFQNLKTGPVKIFILLSLGVVKLIYLHRHTKEEGEKIHERETREQLFLQKHGGVEVGAVFCCGIVLMGNIHLVIHDYHVDHHTHHRHTENQAHQEGPPPPKNAKMFVSNCFVIYHFNCGAKVKFSALFLV